jgi:hypothetical protein
MMQKVRPRTLPCGHSARTACKHAISGSFDSPLGVLFTFPSRYLYTIGLLVVFSLTRWSSQIQAGLHVSRLTWERYKGTAELLLTGLSPSMAGLS